MHCTINSASNFSGLQAGISPISPAQLAATVRKSTLDRPFILPILTIRSIISAYDLLLEDYLGQMNGYVRLSIDHQFFEIKMFDALSYQVLDHFFSIWL